MDERKAYPSDLKDKEWKRIEPFLVRGIMGRPMKHEARELINAIFYVLQTGCSWRALPHDLPPWQTVYAYFRKLQREGTWQRMNDVLRQDVRVQAGVTRNRAQPASTARASKRRKKGGTGL
jgi:transposase